MQLLRVEADEWVLELKNYPSNSSIKSSPSSSNNAKSTSSCYESCSNGTPNSLPLPSLSPSSSSSSRDNKSSTSHKGKKLFSKERRSNSCMLPNFAPMVTCHGHEKLWNVVKSSCMACFKPNKKKQNKCKRICPNSNSNTSNGLGHKRNGSVEMREEDLKEAILFCKKSAGLIVD